MALGYLSNLIGKAVEKLTEYMGVISSDHAYLHQGKGFTVVGETPSITAGETYKFTFKTPKADDPKVNSDRRYIHWRPSVVAGTDTGVSYKLFKNSTSISGGTTVVPENMNQNINTKSEMQWFKIGATVTDGTAFQAYMSGTGNTGVATESGGGGANHERILESDTEYTVTIKNESGSTATTAIYEFFWYEERGFRG